MDIIASRIHRIKPSPSSMAGQRARELAKSGRDIIALTAGEPDFDTPENVCQAAARAMAQSRTKYTDVGGTPELKAAIRAKFKRENELDYDNSEVIACTGGKQVIFNALMSTVEAGVEVIVPAPYWVSYPDIVLLAGGTPVVVPCPADNGFKLRPEDLERAITPKTRWLILNAPNNPSGAVYSRDELLGLAAVLARHPHVWVMTDDMYEHVLYDGRRYYTMAQVAPELKPRTLTVNGVSKAYAMTGWRIGYGAGPATLIKAMTKLQSQSTSNPSSISQAAAAEALAGPQDFIAQRCAVFQDRRDKVVAALNAIPGIHCHLPEGAFYVYPSCAELLGKTTPQGKVLRTDEDFVLYLLDEVNLAVLQGDAYGMSPYFRISFATSMDLLEQGISRIAQAVERLR
ncbi:aspartate transaminase [Bordetella pseudohinzii]|uniref:Aminotransferase n=1 Tax=Bordetella pseudohinzii TaxID=1331258 RepID=A0A0J6BYT5_9BORD|nr:aspartate transaminase [Bordetella pseudohinzii]ANY17777.1 aspartate aminotransferase [Bordetella pseudohinzii]KMM23823.1 aspartate aminotransferase [Bordetella pseudohinzii]KXA75231.1 aspartate aminotransferase [Bordetella pseudohinzii]KXA76202.1 aspartate aminotransferase [Bordetella pseudohinzii]CUI76656.1 Aspartate aminotransferase [Bordetella pseudohinzii]